MKGPLHNSSDAIYYFMHSKNSLLAILLTGLDTLIIYLYYRHMNTKYDLNSLVFKVSLNSKTYNILQAKENLSQLYDD